MSEDKTLQYKKLLTASNSNIGGYRSLPCKMGSVYQLKMYVPTGIGSPQPNHSNQAICLKNWEYRESQGRIKHQAGAETLNNLDLPKCSGMSPFNCWKSI